MQPGIAVALKTNLGAHCELMNVADSKNTEKKLYLISRIVADTQSAMKGQYWHKDLGESLPPTVLVLHHQRKALILKSTPTIWHSQSITIQTEIHLVESDRPLSLHWRRSDEATCSTSRTVSQMENLDI